MLQLYTTGLNGQNWAHFKWRRGNHDWSSKTLQGDACSLARKLFQDIPVDDEYWFNADVDRRTARHLDVVEVFRWDTVAVSSRIATLFRDEAAASVAAMHMN